MRRVTITTRSGRRLRVSSRLADALVRRGRADAGESEPELEDLTVAELRERAEGLEIKGSGAAGGVVKADLIKALRSPERYQRRDMRAEE
jgi:hypothetical protein